MTSETVWGGGGGGVEGVGGVEITFHDRHKGQNADLAEMFLSHS